MWSVLDQATIDAIVETALKGGVTWFDTAQAYGNGRSEHTLSAALHALGVRPGEVVIATKWLPILKTAADIPRSIDTRLDRLSGYPIDLHQIHIPWSISSIQAQVTEMARLARAGKIRAFGVSNFSAAQMARASAAALAEGMTLASNQVSISALDRRIERNGVLDLARASGVTLIAYSPLAQGVLTGKFHEDPRLASTLPRGRRSRLSPASRAFTAANLRRTRPLIDALRAVATAHGATPSQVALSWLIRFYGDTVVAIPGASRAEHASESAAAMDLELSENEMARIDEVSARVARF